MGEVGHEVLLLLGVALQGADLLLDGFRHGVEAEGQVADLIQGLHVRPHVVLPLLDELGGLREGADGPGYEVGDEEHGPDAHGHGDQVQ